MSTKTWRFPGCTVSRIHLPMQGTQEMQDLSLGQEDPLEKEMATHSSILAWKIPWTEGNEGLQSMGSQKSQTQLSQLNNNILKKKFKMEVIWPISIVHLS